MILSFRHAGLEKFFHTGSKAGIQPAHETKLRILLTALDAASAPQQLNIPAWRFHALTGSLQGQWALSVNGNWRITFTFQGEDVVLVDYVDDH